VKVAVARRNEMGNAATDNLNSGKIRFYSGTRPANADTALSGNTLLAECTFGATAFGTMSAGVATANTITQDASADASGIPTFARLLESDGTTVWADVSVGKTGGAEELLINTMDGSGNPFIAAGGPVSISSLTVTFGVGT
jgi:hypothetical protein